MGSVQGVRCRNLPIAQRRPQALRPLGIATGSWPRSKAEATLPPHDFDGALAGERMTFLGRVSTDLVDAARMSLGSPERRHAARSHLGRRPLAARAPPARRRLGPPPVDLPPPRTPRLRLMPRDGHPLAGMRAAGVPSRRRHASVRRPVPLAPRFVRSAGGRPPALPPPPARLGCAWTSLIGSSILGGICILRPSCAFWGDFDRSERTLSGRRLGMASRNGTSRTAEPIETQVPCQAFPRGRDL